MTRDHVPNGTSPSQLLARQFGKVLHINDGRLPLISRLAQPQPQPNG